MDQRKQLISVIVSSYNQPKTLRLVLLGLALQTDQNFEVIIADDGSRGGDSAVLALVPPAFPYSLRVVTQEDRGFRKSRILNQAVATSNGEILVFCDGDCLPYPDQIAVYRRFCQPGSYLTGGVVFLDYLRSQAITTEMIRGGLPATLINPEERRQLTREQVKARFYTMIRKSTRPRILGGNCAVTRPAFFRINGFDSCFDGYGGDDSDLRNRLNNSGALPIPVWDKAIALHLDHGLDLPRCPVEQERNGRDRERLYANQGRIQIPQGVREAEGQEPVEKVICPEPAP